MILGSAELQRWVEAGGVKSPSLITIGPASVDLRWSGRLLHRNVAAEQYKAEPGQSVLLLPGGLYLLDTMETVTIPPDMSGLLTLRSSMGRMGVLQTHVGFFEPGFTGTATVCLYSAGKDPVPLYRGDRFCQIVLWKTSALAGPAYNGRYQGQDAPTASMGL